MSGNNWAQAWNKREVLRFHRNTPHVSIFFERLADQITLLSPSHLAAKATCLRAVHKYCSLAIRMAKHLSFFFEILEFSQGYGKTMTAKLYMLSRIGSCDCVTAPPGFTREYGHCSHRSIKFG